MDERWKIIGKKAGRELLVCGLAFFGGMFAGVLWIFKFVTAIFGVGIKHHQPSNGPDCQIKIKGISGDIKD
jgi:hypothetical protein